MNATKKDLPKVSIITPFFNAGKYIAEAITSVIGQSYSSWELLLINDGSRDNSREVADRFSDRRIRYFEQENRGVAAARNIGLMKMTGDFFTFLDADDRLPFDSLSSRVKLFTTNRKLKFVDGSVIKMDSDFRKKIGEWTPGFQGNPFEDLITLGGKAFFGLTWMVRRNESDHTVFREGLSHGEDLLFCLELARKGGEYGYVETPVLYYRDAPDSAMKNLKGLENGYHEVLHAVKDWPECRPEVLAAFKEKVKRIMFRSYARDFQIKRALRVYFGVK